GPTSWSTSSSIRAQALFVACSSPLMTPKPSRAPLTRRSLGSARARAQPLTEVRVVPNLALQQTAAAILVPREIRALSAAASADLCRAAHGRTTFGGMQKVENSNVRRREHEKHWYRRIRHCRATARLIPATSWPGRHYLQRQVARANPREPAAQS